jgi:signal transduction histidine kinase
MTSHELRNPLSAVIQCADSVINSLQQLPAWDHDAVHQEADISKAEAEVRSCIESLQIIVSCSMHQKRVIDDVLTLSKVRSSRYELSVASQSMHLRHSKLTHEGHFRA